jgi:hypothetical protein
MKLSAGLCAAIAFLAMGGVTDIHAAPRTVCTITVNSSDEKDMFRQRLPKDQYRFVELVERGRPDWLASACSQEVRCDILVISGHFDGVTEFYSDQVEASEYLPVAEMERASCSESCPGLFSQLKEVYLSAATRSMPTPSRARRPKSGGGSFAPVTRPPTRAASRRRSISSMPKVAATGCGGSSPTCR